MQRGIEPTMTRMTRPQLGTLTAFALVGVAVFGAACDREEIHSYRVPKSAPAPRMAGGGMGGMNPELPARNGAAGQDLAPSSSSATVVWDVPPAWKTVQSNQPMRIATYDASGAEVTVTAFPGPAGGTLANVNRWRGQIGIGEIGEAELASLLTTTRVNRTEVSTLAMTGGQGQVMLGAIITPGDGKTWFVKSTTDATAAAALRPTFDAFAKTFRVEGAGAQASAPPASVPAQATPLQQAPTQQAPAQQGMNPIEGRLAHYAAPTNWASEAQTGGIVAAAFTATNAAGGARITATSLANDGGGDLANINRWRGQLGLADIPALSQVQFADLVPGVKVVDLANPAGTDRMIAAFVTVDRSTWFFKLRGSVAGVEAEREHFAAFVRTVAMGAAQ